MSTDFERDETAPTGAMFRDFIIAVGIYCYVRARRNPATVAEIARAFNTTSALAR